MAGFTACLMRCIISVQAKGGDAGGFFDANFGRQLNMCHFDALLTGVENRLLRQTADRQGRLPSLMRHLITLSEESLPPVAPPGATVGRLLRGRTGELAS